MNHPSSTRNLAQAARNTKKDGTQDGEHSAKKYKRRMSSNKRRTRSEDTSQVTKEQAADGYFLFETDILWEILLRLSIESLLTCRCVCKTWSNMIKTPSFIGAQMNFSSQRIPRFICRTVYTSPFFEDLDRLLLWDTELDKTRTMPLKEYVFKNRKIIFSHNGLLCIAPNNCGTRAPLVICNPITRERIELPRPEEIDVKYTMPPVVGFCFVPTRQKHIVVQLSTTSSVEGSYSRVTRCYILTSGQSSWRLLTHCPSLTNCSIQVNTVYWNNAFHWIFGERGPGILKESILSFDTVHETFQVISCPEEVVYLRQWTFSLRVLDGRLTLMKRDKNIIKRWEITGNRVGEFSLACRETYALDDTDDTREFVLRSRPNKHETLLTSMHNGSLSICTDFVIASDDMIPFRIPVIGLPDRFTTVAYNPSLASVRSMDLPRFRRCS